MNSLYWIASHSDGSKVVGDWDTPNGGHYNQINRKLLTDIELKERVTGKSILKLHLEVGQRVIIRRRVWQDVMSGATLGFVYLVGWQRTTNGKNEQVVYHILPDGKIQKADTWLGGDPELREDEK